MTQSRNSALAQWAKVYKGILIKINQDDSLGDNQGKITNKIIFL